MQFPGSSRDNQTLSNNLGRGLIDSDYRIAKNLGLVHTLQEPDGLMDRVDILYAESLIDVQQVGSGRKNRGEGC